MCEQCPLTCLVGLRVGYGHERMLYGVNGAPPCILVDAYVRVQLYQVSAQSPRCHLLQ